MLQEIDTRTIPGLGRSCTIFREDDGFLVALEGTEPVTFTNEADAWHAWLHPFAAGFTLSDEGDAPFPESSLNEISDHAASVLIELTALYRELSGDDFQWLYQQTQEIAHALYRERF